MIRITDSLIRTTVFTMSLVGALRAAADQPAAGELNVQQRQGAAIYKKRCASCHGKQGEGVKQHHPEPLTGDASVGELAQLISDTMPEKDPDQCVGKDAEAVAAYIHFAFYSRAARVRNRPPRIGLARLTGTQLRQSLADLYSQSTGSAGKRGIPGRYFDGARWRKDKQRIDRIDKVIDFDFGDAGPGEGINSKDFFIQWRGGLKADTTGRYEIIIRSTCAFVCNLGTFDREFINNRVQSGDKTEFRKSIVLTGGRVYPFQIDFYQRKRKTGQPPARISLSWVPPRRVEQIVPTANLIADSVRPSFSLQTPLPPDDRSYGYVRGISVDRQWDRATTQAALEFAQIAISELWPQYRRRHRREPDKNREQLRRFLERLVETAFRGPPDDDTRKRYIDQSMAATPDDHEVIKRCLLMTLKSPRFIYPLLDRHRSRSQQSANRLALTLFDSLPSDDWLQKLVNDKKLANEDQIRAAARRMVHDVRTQAKTLDFLHQWLYVDHLDDIVKDSSRFPGFDAKLVSDLRDSFDAFLHDVVWSESGDYRQFFLSTSAFTSPRLAAFYGSSWNSRDVDPDTGRMRTGSHPDHHLGVLSHPLLTSGLAYHDSTSPIHRGVFVIRHLLGRTLRPPNEAFTPLSPDLHPDLTTRERVALQTSPENCQVCHLKINGLGFILENFDAVGRFRQQERGKPIQTSGQYRTRSDQVVKLAGARDLAEFLANNSDAHRAFVTRAFQHFAKQPIAAYGPDTLERLTRHFRKNDYSVPQLLVEIAVTASLPPPKLE